MQYQSLLKVSREHGTAGLCLHIALALAARLDTLCLESSTEGCIMKRTYNVANVTQPSACTFLSGLQLCIVHNRGWKCATNTRLCP